MMEFLKDAKAKAAAWIQERKEKAEAKRALRSAAASEHMHGRFFLLHVPAMATICAAFVEWYWAILFCIEATGHIALDWMTQTGSDTPAQGAWHFALDIQSIAVLIGLVAATIPIVMLSMVWLPVQFAMRGTGRWRRGTVILVGLLANVLVIVSGTVVMNFNRQEQVREALVVEQTAAQGRAAIDARLAFEQEQLRLALNNANPYLNQAANVGAAEWERSYVAQARASNDPRLPMLERALGAARAADQRRANIERLTIERATAAPEAASAASVEDTVGRELNTFAQVVEVWRPPFVAVICTLIGIFGAWWVLALIQGMNPRDILRSGWASEAERIEDLRDQPSVNPQPMKPAREVVTDAETGEELIKIKPREHWRKRKGKPQKLDVQPEIPPDETGVEYDGGSRTAVTIGRLMEVPLAAGEVEPLVQPDHEAAEAGDQEGDGVDEKQADEKADDEATSVHPDSSEELPYLSDESGEGELEAELPESVATAEPEAHEEAAVTESTEGDEQAEQENHNEPSEREPETDPSKLIAAE